MARWHEDEFWGDFDAESVPGKPIESEVEGSVYMVPDRLWRFEVADREHHPGACVRCDIRARISFLNKGTDIHSARPERFLYIVVEPSRENGLTKPTAFALDPRRIRLHALRNLHEGSEWLGRLEHEYFRRMQEHFESLGRRAR